MYKYVIVFGALQKLRKTIVKVFKFIKISEDGRHGNQLKKCISTKREKS